MIALQQKRIGCHFCHQFTLNKVGSLSLATGTCNLQTRIFNQTGCKYLIGVVIKVYLTVTLHDFTSKMAMVEKVGPKAP